MFTMDGSRTTFRFAAGAFLGVTAVLSTALISAPAQADSGFTSRMTGRYQSFTDADGTTWGPRSDTLGTWATNNIPTGTDITGTTNDGLYAVSALGVKTYSLPVPTAGTYRVRLLMTETWFTKAGQRVFDVTAENTPALTGIDIAGAVGRYAAYERSFDTTVTDGTLNLTFTPRADQPIIAAIEVTKVTTPEPTTPPEEEPAPEPTEPKTDLTQLAGVTTQAVDGGGPAYYAKFTNSLPTSAASFPLAVWYSSVGNQAEIDQDRATGINTYVALTKGSNLSLVQSSGMKLLTQAENLDISQGKTNGWTLSDEVDMWAGAGDAAWTGKVGFQPGICNPSTAKCGYTVMATMASRLPADGLLRYSNYGKGVLFWSSAAQGARFVNDYQDVVSSDAYWYTDRNICGQWEGGIFRNRTNPAALSAAECHKAANYGDQIRYMRSLVKPAQSKPVWGFVELGHPSGDNTWPQITPTQVRAATWHSLIAGARGIVYFNHSFGGKCTSYNIIRDGCYTDVRNTVSALNAQITTLAPVLNSPDVNGLVTAPATVDTLTKEHNGDLYVFAASRSTASQTAKLGFTCKLNATAEVIDEKRSVKVVNGQLSDSFPAETSVHLYKIPGGAGQCVAS